MIRPTLVLSLLALAPASLAAQGFDVPAGACSESSPAQGGRASFSSQADNIRIVLCGGVKYLAETNRGGNFRLDLRPLTPGVQNPQIREGMMGPGIEGGRSWVIDVGATGIYEIRVIGAGGGMPVDLTITPRQDNRQKQAADSAKKAQEKAKKEAEKAEKERKKAEEKARKDAEKQAKEAGQGS